MNWIPLVDYSNKYKVSISTLRRRIKLENIPFKLDGGKYFILDDHSAHRSEPKSKVQIDLFENRPPTKKAEPRMVTQNKPEAPPEPLQNEFFLAATGRMLDEIKKAYTLILQEKDEQVKILREEVADLKTLVRVLEDQVNRLQSESKPLEFD